MTSRNTMRYLWLLVIYSFLYAKADKMYVGTKNVNTTKEEVRLCTRMELDDNNTYHFTRFQPAAGKNVRHMVLVGCEEPGTDQKYWNCGQIGNVEPGYIISNHCKNRKDSLWIYDWRFGATKDGLSLPQGFSFQVGKDTKYKHLIFEVHYDMPTISKGVDESKAGIIITYDKKPITNTEVATVDIQKNEGLPIPMKKTTTVDVLSTVPAVMRPLMFHVHIHGLGTKVSAYLIKRNAQKTENPTWILIGQQSPPRPENHLPVANDMTMEPGDLLGLRCTYYNDRDHDIKLGPKDTDEMCEFVIYYAAERGSEIPSFLERRAGDWNEMGLKNIPADA